MRRIPTAALVIALAGASGCFTDSPTERGEASPHEAVPSTGGGVTTSSGRDGSESSGSTGTEDTAAPSASSSSSSSTDAESSSGESDEHIIGPIVITNDLDDGAIHPAGNGYSATWHPSGEYNDAGEQFLGEWPVGEHYYGFVRFELPEAIPSGSIIAAAELELWGWAVHDWDGTRALHVWGQDSADAPAVSNVSNVPDDGNGFALSPMSVRWPEENGLSWVIAEVNVSSDLAPILQWLVDNHDGLDAGAHVQLFISVDALDGINEEVGWLDSAAGQRTAPRLTITLADH
jgi:hypothetical protein